MNANTLSSHIRDLIARNELSEALEQLRTILDNSPLLDEAILQAARFADIRKQIRLGLVDHKEANLTQGQIRAGLLDLVGEMETQLELGAAAAQPKAAALRSEMEAAISVLNSKNVVIGSTITAGGDVHIGDTTIQNAEKIYNIEKIDNANFS